MKKPKETPKQETAGCRLSFDCHQNMTRPSPALSPLSATRSGRSSRSFRAGAAETMMAAILTRPGCFEMGTVPMPVPAPDQIRVRVEGCGVGSSALPAWEGKPWFHYPFAPGALGHEAWGVIDAVGSDVDYWHPGERVGILSHNGYAQYDLAHFRNVVRLPDTLEGQPFPARSLGCAVNIFRRSCINKGDIVAILGAGFLGLLLTQLAALAEAKVIVLSRRPYALGFAAEMGAAHTFPMALDDLKDCHDLVRSVRDLTRGPLCDIVIEATGKQGPLGIAAELTRERGRLVVAGYHQDGPRQINMQLWNWRGLDVINAHERSQAIYLEGMREAVAAVDAGLLTPEPLYTHRFPLERLNEAMRLTAQRPKGFMKAVIEF